MRRTTYLYVLKETFPVFFIGLMVFTIILLMDKILKLIELIVTRGGSIKNVFMLISFHLPLVPHLYHSNGGSSGNPDHFRKAFRRQ